MLKEYNAFLPHRICCRRVSVCLPVRRKPVLSTTSLYMKRKAHVACNLNHLFENEGLL